MERRTLPAVVACALFVLWGPSGQAHGDRAAPAGSAAAANAAFDQEFGSSGHATFRDDFGRSVARARTASTPINLLSYATGDGTTPASGGINAALVAASATGRPLLAPPGSRFLIDQPVLLPSHVTLIGTGAIFRASPSLGNAPVMRNLDTASGNTDIALIGLEVDGNRAARGVPGGMAHGLWLRGGDASPVRNVLLQDLKVHGAPMLGVPLQNVQDAVVANLESYDHGRDGLTFYWNSRRVRIIGARIHDCGDDLIGLNAEDGASTGHILSDFYIQSPRLARQHHMGSGIAVHGARRVLVKDARVDSPFHAGLSVGNWNTTPAEDVTVDGLTVTNAGAENTTGGGHGVELNTDAWNRSLAGNAGARRVTLRNVTVQGARAAALGLLASATGPIQDVSVGARIFGSSRYPGSRAVASHTGFLHHIHLDAEVHGAQHEGISIRGGSGWNSDLSLRPRVYDSGVATPSLGVDVAKVRNLRIENGVSTDTRTTRRQLYGLRLEDVTGNGAVRGNDLRRNARGGLLTNRVGPGIVIADNLLDGRAPMTLRIAPRQRLLRRRAVVVVASCKDGCRLKAGGLVRLGLGAPTLRLRGVRTTLRPARARELRLRLSKRQVGALRRWLRAHRRRSGQVTVVGRTAGAGAARARSRIRLR